MKTSILSPLIATILLGCSSMDNQHKEETSPVKKITTTEYYANGKIKRTSEMSADSVLNGPTTWFDSTGLKVSEEIYLNGKLNGLTKSFFENGQIAKETVYANDSIVQEKEYNSDGTFLYQFPIDVKDIGAIKVMISHDSCHYLRKNTADTVKIYAENLPITNKVVFVKNAKIRAIGNEKYILTPFNNAHSVKIVFKLKKHTNDEICIPIDSTEIEVK